MRTVVPIPSMSFPGRNVKELDAEMVCPTPRSAADADAIRISSAIAQGDEAAFWELYDAYHERLLRLAVVIGRGEAALAQEVVQATMLTAAAKLKRVTGEEHLWNWLARVARQHLAKVWRQQQRQPALVDLEPLTESLGAREADKMLEQHVDAALSELSDEERVMVEWFYFDGLSHQEIATRRGVTAKAVSSRLERTREKLRAILKQKMIS